MKLVLFTSQHFPQLLTWFSDAQIMQAMGMDTMNEFELESWTKDGKIILMATNDSSELVGMVNFYNYKTQKPVYEIGYLIDPQHQGKGLGTQLVAEAITWVRQHHPEIKEITESYVEEFNTASRKILEKNGFEMYQYRLEKQRYYYRLRL